MPETRELITLALVAIAACLILLSWRQILEALDRFRGGGPRPPKHPLPGDDGFIVRRKPRQASFR
jgi:hypothetical protein